MALIYKPKGITSFELVLRLKKMLNAKKVGHTGTLDPNASGLMIILINNATKYADRFKNMEKEYIGTIKLHEKIERTEVERVFKSMKGKKVLQTPPKKSAVARKRRERKICDLEILDFDGRNLRFRIVCEAGFYVRKFASDIGDMLGIKSHLSQLKRIRIGKFNIKDSHTIDELKDKNKWDKIIIPL